MIYLKAGLLITVGILANSLWLMSIWEKKETQDYYFWTLGYYRVCYGYLFL